MDFYDFCNRETFHVFRWLYSADLNNIAELIAQAFEAVEGDDWYEMGVDPSTVACDKLADLLEDYVWEIANAGLGVETVERDADAIDLAQLYGSTAERLCIPFVHQSLQSVAWKILAQAVLIREGKWSPDRDVPDVL